MSIVETMRFMDKMAKDTKEFNELSMHAFTGRTAGFSEEFINYLPPKLREVLRTAMDADLVMKQSEMIVNNNLKLPLSNKIAVMNMAEEIMESMTGLVRLYKPDVSEEFEENMAVLKEQLITSKKTVMESSKTGVQEDENRVMGMSEFSRFINSFIFPLFRDLSSDTKKLWEPTEKEFAERMSTRLGKREKKEKDKKTEAAGE